MGNYNYISDREKDRVALALRAGRDIYQIARFHSMHPSTVFRVQHNLRHFGAAVPPRRPAGRPRHLSNTDRTYLLSLVHQNPTINLEILQNRLHNIRGVDVSVPTISRALCRLGITWKRVSRRAAEQNELVREAFRNAMEDLDPNKCVWVDETSKDERTTFLRNGWDFSGLRARVKHRFHRGKRYSLLPALSTEGMGWCTPLIVEGSVTGAAFEMWLECTLVNICCICLYTCLTWNCSFQRWSPKV